MSKLFFSKRWAFSVAVFTILILSGISAPNNQPLISIAMIIVGSILLLGYILFFPNSFSIDEKGIVIYYGLGMKTIAKWNELHIIEERHDKAFPWLKEYHIGYFKTRIPLWEIAYIPKSKKASILIEKYYKKSIEKFS